jgi:hypothetical protein
MAGKRIFTDQELKELGGTTLEKVQKAIDSGDKEKAKKLAIKAQKEYQHLHDGYMVWVTGLLSYIYKNHGISCLEEAERSAHTIEAKLVFKPPEKTDFKSVAEHRLKGLKGHMQPVTVEEDDEKIIMTMHPCGSGERIIQMGGYDAGLARVKEAHPITWGKKDFPIYCCHCPIGELLTFDRTGDLVGVKFEPEEIGKGRCGFVNYKNIADIPEKFYQRIGKKRPTAKK